LKRVSDDVLGRLVAASTELLLDQTLTLGIETNSHTTPVYPPVSFSEAEPQSKLDPA
jgi:hypothetical protein